MHVRGRRWEYDLLNELSGGIGIIWDVGKAEAAACTAGSCPGPKPSSAWVAHTELPQPGALGLVGHTLAGTPFPGCSHFWLEGNLSEMH